MNFLDLIKLAWILIEDLGIQSQSILITSHYEEANVRINCERLGVQLIPKEMASYVPIIIKTEYKADAILIDDDPLIRACWELSAIEKKKVSSSYFQVPMNF